MKQMEDWALKQTKRRCTPAKIFKVEFPRSTEDFEYLWEQLAPTLRKVGKERAHEAWKRLRNLDYVTFK